VYLDYNGKYLTLKRPITFPERGDVPAATYEYLYVRHVDPYQSQVSDVDFVMSEEDFERYKSMLDIAEFSHGMRLFGRPEENMIELWLPDRDMLYYVAENRMVDIV
jgi:hypothetical protein